MSDTRIQVKHSTDDKGRDTYTWEGCNGLSEFVADARDQSFIQWAVGQGYDCGDAVLVMAECGDDFDTDPALSIAWQAWTDGYMAGVNA